MVLSLGKGFTMTTLTVSEPVEIAQEVLDTIEHITSVEMEADSGYRYRATMPENEVDAYITKEQTYGAMISDMECAMSCPCTKLRFPSWFTD